MLVCCQNTCSISRNRMRQMTLFRRRFSIHYMPAKKERRELLLSSVRTDSVKLLALFISQDLRDFSVTLGIGVTHDEDQKQITRRSRIYIIERRDNALDLTTSTDAFEQRFYTCFPCFLSWKDGPFGYKASVASFSNSLLI